MSTRAKMMIEGFFLLVESPQDVVRVTGDRDERFVISYSSQ